MRYTLLVAFALMLAHCDGSSVPSPFAAETTDAGPEAGDAAMVLPPPVPDGAAGQSNDGLGGPCLDDEQCDDGFACTFDACDTSVRRCRHTPNDAQCEDGVYCNGVERCLLGTGCRPGEPVACADGTACTIDACNEATRDCEHSVRDADGDGDPDINCAEGADCDERDPRVSSLVPEICNNAKDDDCDGEKDESACVEPAHDICADALEITASGSYALDPTAAGADTSAGCYAGGALGRDLFVAVIVPEGDPVDVDVVASSSVGDLGLATSAVCGDTSTETACARGGRTPSGMSVARLVLRAPEPGAHAVTVFTNSDSAMTLSVDFRPAEPAPANETCGTAGPLALGESVRVGLVGAVKDLASACGSEIGDLVYRFSLAEPRDVRVFATSVDGFGEPVLSLRREPCAQLSDEIVCRVGSNEELFWRGLAAGDYYVGVGATAPTEVDLRVVSAAPSKAPADDGCESAPEITPNRTVSLDFDDHVDDVRLDCALGSVDSVYSLVLEERADVLLVQRISDGDEGAVNLTGAACASPAIACEFADVSPVRAAVHDLGPGSYKAVAESRLGTPSTLTAFVRPARPPILVAFADTCAEAVEVPPGGGFFQGNSSNAGADYDAGCDLGGLSAGGAPDQMLRLSLDSRQRVVLDARGSTFTTLIDLRRGPGCPGSEVAQGCAVGFNRSRSFVDRILDAGDYFIQIDGYAGAAGAWFLDVYVVDP